MRIKKLSFKNNSTGWYIDNIMFNKLTLLVGASGVGKTQILRIIMGLQRISNGSSISGWSWSIEFEEKNCNYKWNGEFSDSNDDEESDGLPSKSIVTFEQVYVDDVQIIDRTANVIIFKGKETPKLDSSRSIISLLKEEDVMKPISNAWNRLSILTLDDNSTRRKFSMVSSVLDSIHDLDLLKGMSMPLILKLYILFRDKNSIFENIENVFKEIFPLVEEIDFDIKTINNATMPLLKIKEKDVDKWISQVNISSGMFRTLLQIIMIVLAEDGDVILIDEFENSLGVNCIDSVADLVINSDSNIQFIITSHHPYIINNIDFKNWKIVTRNGSKVSVVNPEDLHIGIHSKHDAFIQLVQTDAYKKGVL